VNGGSSAGVSLAGSRYDMLTQNRQRNADATKPFGAQLSEWEIRSPFFSFAGLRLFPLLPPLTIEVECWARRCLSLAAEDFFWNKIAATLCVARPTTCN
jgi:hypothetical protein